MKYAIGIDVGGTNIRISIVNSNGEIFNTIKEETNAKCKADLLNRIIELINKIDTNGYEIEGIGIGIPGPVTSDGVVLSIPNCNIFESFNLKEEIEKVTKYKVIVGNDANVAGLAEAIFGAGKGCNICQYITMSTGIGGGLVINKKLILGNNGSAQEIGSMIINPNGYDLKTGKPKGCIEYEASGTALISKAKDAGIIVNNAGEIFASNDPICKKLVEEFTNNIGMFIGSIYSYIGADIIILGGGITKSASYFLDTIIEKTKIYADVSSKNLVNIKLAKFTQDCGIIGAACLILNETCN